MWKSVEWRGWFLPEARATWWRRFLDWNFPLYFARVCIRKGWMRPEQERGFFAVAFDGTIVRSLDGILWTRRYGMDDLTERLVQDGIA